MVLLYDALKPLRFEHRQLHDSHKKIWGSSQTAFTAHSGTI